MATAVKKRWHRQETRNVRPFRSSADYLKDVGLRLYPDEEFKSIDSLQIASIDKDRLAVSVRVPAVPSNLEEVVGISPSELQMVITLEDRVFKSSQVVTSVPLSELKASSRIFDIDAQAVSRMSWAGETRVHIAVVLSNSRSGELGTAQRLGSWVARKTISVGNPRDTAAFAIEAVDPEYFEKRSLPSTTTYLVEISDPDLNQSCDNLADLVKVSLAKDVHAALAKDEESLMAKALIKSIYVDVVSTVLVAGYAALGDSSLQENSILDVVTTKLTKSTGVSAEKLRLLSKDPAGSQLRAVVQADIELSRALIGASQRRYV